jgi:predicted acylesterase/phospholipase RssA
VFNGTGQQMKKILSIDAGGVRGIVPAIILAEIEARTGQPVSNLFDFFAGTSTGGMLALGLNRPERSNRLSPLFSASAIERLFHKWGDHVFANKLSKTERRVTTKTSASRIEELFREYFGDTLLSSSLKPTMVTAFNLTSGQPYFFNSAKTGATIDGDVLMWQAARATTAISTHFSPYRLVIPSSLFRRAYEVCLVDGSLFASNPAMLALAEARTLFPGEDDFFLLSLGCGEAARTGLPAELHQTRRHIFESSLTAQSACTDYQLQAFLPPQHYLRIQANIGPGSARIDDASEEYFLSMHEIAQETIRRYAKLLDRVVDVLAPDPLRKLELGVA